MPKTPRLREWREHATLSQSELATRSGISRATIADLEAGNRGGQPRTIRRLAKALSIEPENLYREPAFPKARSPLSAERALAVADSDQFRRAVEDAPTTELQQTALELASFTRKQSRERPSSYEAAKRRAAAQERIAIINGVLDHRGASSPVELIVRRFNDAMTPSTSPHVQESRDTA